MRFEVIAAVKMLMVVFWDVMSYGLVYTVSTRISEEHLLPSSGL
jgi:hypothetical protein